MAKWSGDVKTKWDPPEGLFKSGSAEEIASASLKGHDGDPGAAIQALQFYINRAGENLDADRKKVIQNAIEKLQAKNKESIMGDNFKATEEFNIPGSEVTVEKGDMLKVEASKKTEGSPRELKFKTTANSTPFSKEDEEFFDHQDVIIAVDNEHAFHQDLPCNIWDSSIAIKGNDLVIEGGVGAGGFGKVVLTVPKAKCPFVFIAMIPPSQNSEILTGTFNILTKNKFQIL